MSKAKKSLKDSLVKIIIHTICGIGAIACIGFLLSFAGSNDTLQNTKDYVDDGGAYHLVNTKTGEHQVMKNGITEQVK